MPYASRSRRTAAKCCYARLAQRLSDLGRALQHLLYVTRLRVEVVEHAERTGGRLLSRRRVEPIHVRVEPFAQTREICRPAFATADRIEGERELGDAQPNEERMVELDHLGVDRRIVRADRLDRELPVFPVATSLRRRVPVHRADRVELERLRLTVHAVLDVRTADRRRPLGAQGQRSARSILEGVHLLLHDVRARTGRALEERGVLEHRCDDRPVAVERAESLRLADHQLPARLLFRNDVVCPTRPLDLRRQAVRSARSSARNGLRASSSPSVVLGPCPGYTAVSAGRVSTSERIDASRTSQSAPGRSVRPTEPCEQHVAREQASLRVEREMSGRVARHREDVERDAGHLDRLATFEQDVRRVRTHGYRRGREAVRILEQRSLPVRHEHLRSGSIGELCDAHEMVPVAVRHEDCRARRPEPRQLEPQLGGISARIDHHGLLGGCLGANDVAVRSDRSERKLFDPQSQGELSSRRLRAGLPAS